MFCMNISLMFLLLKTIVCEPGPEGFGRQQPLSDILDSIPRTRLGLIKNSLLFSGDISSHERQKRGIVLIDEDFEKLPESGVRQAWGGVGLRAETTENDGFASEDGSGDILIQEGSTAKLIGTVGEQPLSSDQEDITRTSGQGHTSKPQETSTIYPITHHKSSDKPKTTTLTDSTVEGSGDDFLTTLSTKQEDIEVFDDSQLMKCLNQTCGARDIDISPGFAESLAEDATLILSCSMANSTKSDILRWYKANGSDTALLQTSATNHQLQFTLPKVKVEDSGRYACLRKSKDLCCHRQLDVTVYKKPNYKYHLLILGLVVVVSLFTCCLLSMHRRHKVKQYKKQLNNSIPMNEFLL